MNKGEFNAIIGRMDSLLQCLDAINENLDEIRRATLRMDRRLKDTEPIQHEPIVTTIHGQNIPE